MFGGSDRIATFRAASNDEPTGARVGGKVDRASIVRKTRRSTLRLQTVLELSKKGQWRSFARRTTLDIIVAAVVQSGASWIVLLPPLQRDRWFY